MKPSQYGRGSEIADENQLSIEDIPLDIRQRDAYAQWTTLAAQAYGTPLRSGFKPEQSRLAMPAGMWLHAKREAGEVCLWQRIEGRLVSMALGEGRGERLEKIYNLPFLSRFIPRLLETVIAGRPSMTKDMTKTATGSDFNFTRLILPFREDSGDISRLFVVFNFDSHALGKLDEPLPVRREKLEPAALYYQGSPKRMRA